MIYFCAVLCRQLFHLVSGNSSLTLDLHKNVLVPHGLGLSKQAFKLTLFGEICTFYSKNLVEKCGLF